MAIICRGAGYPYVEATKKHRPKLETSANALDTDTNLRNMTLSLPMKLSET